ncbi:MAG: von Willebrand factor type A domain-containing protein [Ferruginibacter sp.]
MKKYFIYCLLLFSSGPLLGQYYLRGDIKDEKNQPLSNTKIFVHSSRTIFYSGAYGSFGINVSKLYDTLSLSLDGYEPQLLRVKSDQWQNIVLKITPSNTTKNNPRLISVTKNLKQTSKLNWFISDETYFQLVENEFVKTGDYPNTGFSLNVNKASYSNVRRFINMQSPVPPDAVRVEEMVNYFNLHYREPDAGDVFRIESQLTSCPWNTARQLLFLNVNAKRLSLEKVPPGNFVFLIDVSGSMDMPNRLPLLKAAFQLFVKNLRPIDTVSIVMYGGTVGIWLQPTSGAEKDKISKSIEELTASGDTPGESAIRAAYTLAESTFIKGGNNRIILATDGDFNVGETSEKSLDELITKERQTGVYLTCLGVGMGNFKDSKLQTLAKKGNGNYAYIDDINEAEKVLVKELTQTFYAVADNVFMNLQFNPVMVDQYRLIGFDNRKDALKDGSSDLEGGEIGSGNSTLAIFEIVPTQQNVLAKINALQDNIGEVNLRYNCGDTITKRLLFSVKNNYQHIDSSDRELKFAAAVTMFGLKIKQSKYGDDIAWPQIKLIANASADKTNYLQQEFLQQIDKAEKIYATRKKKKRGKAKNDDE